jgi:hypothetical protein
MPDFVREFLIERGLMTAYKERPAYQQIVFRVILVRCDTYLAYYCYYHMYHAICCNIHCLALASILTRICGSMIYTSGLALHEPDFASLRGHTTLKAENNLGLQWMECKLHSSGDAPGR